MGNFIMKESGWHHLNPLVNLCIPKGGAAAHGGFHNVMCPCEVSPDKLESDSESVALITNIQEIQETEEKIRESNQPHQKCGLQVK